MSFASCFAIFLNVLMTLKSLWYLLVGIILILILVNFADIPGQIEIAMSEYVDDLLKGFMFAGAKPSLLDTMEFAFPIVVLSVGALTLFLGIWDIVAVVKQHKCLLSTAAVLLIIVLAFEVLFATFTGLGLAHKYDDLTDTNFNVSFGGGSSMDFNVTTFKSDLMKLEKEQKCCGINGPTDYTTFMPALDIPESCCLKDSVGNISITDCRAMTKGYIYMKGCSDFVGMPLLMDWIPIGILIGLAFLTLLTFIFTLCVCSSPKKESYL